MLQKSIDTQIYENPWLFNGEPFLDCKHYAGFVYEITDTETGKKYIGKKFFWSHRKLRGKTRRSTIESDWRKYYSSSEIIKQLVKESGVMRFKRRIISLHELTRDVNYTEVKLQYILGVLEQENEQGEMLYYNGNISGKYQSHLVKGLYSRSLFESTAIQNTI